MAVDHSLPCPQYLNKTNDGGCSAPAQYKGSCALGLFFLGISLLDKCDAEVTCQVCWPCADIGTQCPMDYGLSCPRGFSVVKLSSAEWIGPHELCVDVLGTGECEDVVALGNGNEKKQFADRCSVLWPCKVNQALAGSKTNSKVLHQEMGPIKYVIVSRYVYSGETINAELKLLRVDPGHAKNQPLMFVLCCAMLCRGTSVCFVVLSYRGMNWKIFQKMLS